MLYFFVYHMNNAIFYEYCVLKYLYYFVKKNILTIFSIQSNPIKFNLIGMKNKQNSTQLRPLIPILVLQGNSNSLFSSCN